MFFFISGLCYAQSDMVDVLHLKNGSIIKGNITELYPDSLVKIEMFDGSLFVFEMDEVLKILREPRSLEKKGLQWASLNYRDRQEKTEKVQFGLKGGINFASWKVSGESDYESFEHRTDFHAGFFITRYAPTSFRFEILYNRKGAKEIINDPYYGIDSDADYKITCISLLPLIVLGTNDPKDNTFFEFGPEFSFITSKKGDIEFLGENSEENLNNITEFELCFNVGAGIFINNTILIDVRYSFGLKDLITQDYDNSDDIKAFSRTIQLSLGVVL